MTVSEETKDWMATGFSNGWRMPPSPAWKRLPIIRNIRTAWNSFQIERWYEIVPGLRTGYDEWCLYGMSRGF